MFGRGSAPSSPRPPGLYWTAQRAPGAAAAAAALPPRPHIESLSWAVTQSFSLPRFPGRAPETKALGLDKLGVQLNQETGKIVVGADESTSVPNIYAFGDIGEVRWRDGRCRPQGVAQLLFTAASRLIPVEDPAMGGKSYRHSAPHWCPPA